jgi:hypothetical protein
VPTRLSLTFVYIMGASNRRGILIIEPNVSEADIGSSP